DAARTASSPTTWTRWSPRCAAPAPSADADGLPGRREELEGDVVGIAERQPRPVVRVDDPTMADAELVEPALPALQLRAVGAPEGDVVEARAQLVERLRARRRRVEMDAEQRPAHHPDDVMERSGVLVEHGVGIEEALIPGAAAAQIADSHGNMADRGERGHGLLLHGRPRESTMRGWPSPCSSPASRPATSSPRSPGTSVSWAARPPSSRPRTRSHGRSRAMDGS